MNKYGAKANKIIDETMHEYGQGKLKGGKSGKKVTSRKQAVAIGISKAHQKGYKAPARG